MRMLLEQAESHARMAVFSVDEGESVHVLHPNQIAAFQGRPEQRADSLMKLPGMYRKKRLIQARIEGPATFMLGLPEGYCLSEIELGVEDDLLYEFRHVLYYTEGVRFFSQVQSMKNSLITQDLVKMSFQGPGKLGLLTAGPVHAMKLDPVNPLYVDASCLIAYSKKAKLRLCVYGNTIASQHMNYQWEMTGQGTVLIQPCKPDRKLEEHMRSDGLLKRIAREVIPFGGVFIK